MTAAECRCDLRTRLVGDGCAVCNPHYAADHLPDEESDDAIAADQSHLPTPPADG